MLCVLRQVLSNNREQICKLQEQKTFFVSTANEALVGTSIGSLSMRVFETRTAIGRENSACQDSAVSQIFILIISNGEKILSNGNVFVGRQVKRENNSLPLAVHVSKMCVLKLPNDNR